MTHAQDFPPYRQSLARTLYAAREAVLDPSRAILRSIGITEQQWRILRVLADDGPAEPSALSTVAILHQPSVTRIMRELAARGLIERTYDSQNPRRSVVSITPEGIRIVRETAYRIRMLLNPIWDSFGRERLARLQAELSAFTDCAKSQSLDSNRACLEPDED